MSGMRRILMALGLLVLASGCDWLDERAADRIRALLPTAIGPAEQYRVSIDSTSPLALFKGKLAEIRLEGTRVRAKTVPMIDRMELVARDLRYSRRGKRLQALGSAKFFLRWKDDDLNRFWSAGGTLPISALQIRFRSGTVLLTGRYRLTGSWSVPFRLQGVIERSGSAIRLAPTRLDLHSLKVPGGIAKRIVARVNPILNLEQLPLPVRLETLEVGDGTIVAAGTIPASAEEVNRLIAPPRPYRAEGIR